MDPVQDVCRFLLDARTQSVLLFVILLLVLRWFFRRPKNLPPGPWGFPILSSLPAVVLGLLTGSQPHHLFARYARRYGPVFHLELFNKSLVILNDYEAVKEAYQHPQFSDRPEAMGQGMLYLITGYCTTSLIFGSSRMLVRLNALPC